MYPGDARFDAFWAEADGLGMAVFVHALHPVGADRLEAFADLVPLATFPVDTGLSAMTFVRAGVPGRHPRRRLGFSHGGGVLAPLACRLEQGYRITSGFGGALARSPLETLRNFLLDSLVYDPACFDYLAREIAPGNVFAGGDYPYAIEESDLAGFVARSRACDARAMNAAALRSLGR